MDTTTPHTETASRADLDRALAQAIADLIVRQQVNAADYLHLPLHHPDGSRVTVRIDTLPDGFRVSDDGTSAGILEGLLDARSLRDVAKSIAAPLTLDVENGCIGTKAGPDDLYRAICDVAEASWRLTDRLSDRLDRPVREPHHREVGDRLTALFGEQKVERQPSVAGGSGKTWRPSAMLRQSQAVAIVQGVPDQHNGLYHAVAMFHDIRRRDDTLALIALFKDFQPDGAEAKMLQPMAKILPFEAQATDFGL